MEMEFGNTLRSLARDRYHAILPYAAAGLLLLGGWTLWASWAKVVIYAKSESSEVSTELDPIMINPGTSGVVIAAHLELGRQVAAGEPLVELDDRSERLALHRAIDRGHALAGQREALSAELHALEESLASTKELATLHAGELRAEAARVATAATLAHERADLASKLARQGAANEFDRRERTLEARGQSMASEAAKQRGKRVLTEEASQASSQRAAFERLRRDAVELDDAIAAATASVELLGVELDRRTIRAPVAGRLAEVSAIRVGTAVTHADHVATVVPSGDLKVSGRFPQRYVGRLRAGQRGLLRLDGFPWTEYGTIAVEVARVAAGPSGGTLRAELVVIGDSPLVVRLKHGMAGTVHVAIEETTPGSLLWRIAGGGD